LPRAAHEPLLEGRGPTRRAPPRDHLNPDAQDLHELFIWGTRCVFESLSCPFAAWSGSPRAPLCRLI